MENYENVVLCFDNDKAGQTAIDAVKDIFSPNKLKICKLPSKDACDMLQDNKVKAFQEAWWASKTYQPDGIVAGVDTWEAITGKIKEFSFFGRCRKRRFFWSDHMQRLR